MILQQVKMLIKPYGIDDRIRLIIDTQDPKLVDDLRHLNTGRQPKYDAFWDEYKKYLSEVVETSVNERRHGEVSYMAKALSTRDLLSEVAKRCPEGVPVPSKQWLRLQFWPKNPSLKSALQYTGKLQIKFMVQARQLRKAHPDSHYCSALYRYLREMSIKFKENSLLICMDDKHKCKVGEPNLPVAAVERGKQVIVSSSGHKFAVADHDFTKYSITPSVTLFTDIPDSIEGSFYRGQVFVGIKDAVLEASSPLRHSTELYRVMLEHGNSPPILLLFTDGGPDHNVTFFKVQLGLIALFLHLNLDLLEALRTAPYNSWKNPCERVNCILNIGLQAVGLMRKQMPDNMEEPLKHCTSMDDICKEVSKNQALNEALQDSIEPVKLLLTSVFQRLELKRQPFKVFCAASDHKIEGFFDILRNIEPNITQEHQKRKCLSDLPKLKEFIDHCCYFRRYVFGVKKCGESNCKICKPVRLPRDVFDKLHHLPDPTADGEHYKPFDDLYGTETSESELPSLKNSLKESHGMPFSPNAQTARMLIMCSECLRPRVLYSKHKLTFCEEEAVQRSIQNLLFSCGSNLKGLQVEMLPTYTSSKFNLLNTFLFEKTSHVMTVLRFHTIQVRGLKMYAFTVVAKCLSLLKDIIHSVQYANSKVNHLY